MNICIIGCGNIGSGVAKRLFQENQLFLIDHNKNKIDKLVEETQAHIPKNLQEGVEKSDIIILAMKPSGLEKVIQELSKINLKNKIIVSVLTGISLERLKNSFKDAQIIRIMPNIALSTGQAVIGVAKDQTISAEIKEKFEKLMQPLGTPYWLLEEKFDALTSLTGSGPAFLYVILEAMIESGIAMGLKPEESLELVQQMIMGSISVIKETGEHPAKLKWRITTPSGTTIAGLKALEEGGVRTAIMDAFLAAYQRAIELGK